MRLAEPPPGIHLTYCLNIHPGETWADVLEAVRTKATELRRRLAWPGPFGLGLRLSRRAADELRQPDVLVGFREFLRAEQLYVFTINGFPYGQFHGTRVKESVYAPDWRDPERVAYTAVLGEILAALLPDGVPGSISTVPGSYGAWCRSDADLRLVLRGIGQAAAALADVEARTGRRVVLALEPEPDCLWDSTPAVLRLFGHDLPGVGVEELVSAGLSRPRARHVLDTHVGLCYDTCHQAVGFEDTVGALAALETAGVRIAKVQVSAAPVAAVNTPVLREVLARFTDPVYLHQSRVRLPAGDVLRFADLPECLARLPDLPAGCEVRTHVHVPLSVDGWEGLGSTRAGLGPAFFRWLRRGRVAHIELETYTFSVLPEALRAHGVVASLAAEFAWFLGEWQRACDPVP